MASVEIDLLGGFAARVDGTAVSDRAWRLRKARELVKLLALAPGHRLHREQAMDALWRERDPASAANNLNQAVHAARRALGREAILLRDEVLWLEAAVDVDRFEAGAADAGRADTATAYRAALALYGGDLLPENRYDDWAADRRARVAEIAARMREAVATLRVSEWFAVPPPTSSFIGRKQALEELASLLRRTRLLTLAGPGGAVKTRLALELARSVQTPAAGALLVELAPVREQRLVGDALADALDVRALPGHSAVDAAVEFLRSRALLVVLDNCEHVLEGAAVLSERLLRDAQGVTILATSREPLRLAGETLFRVPSLDLPDPEQQLSPELLLEYEAVSLFAARAETAAPGFMLDERNAADVVRICHRLDGLPLALELAAGRIGALTPAAVAARLDHRFALLRTGSPAAPTRQQTPEAARDWPHDLLEPEEAVLFRRLAVFSGGFELEAAELVCSAGDLPVPSVADVLARLVEKSLVAIDDGREERRYRLLETVRVYARDRLAAAGEEAQLSDAHADWALALAERERGSPALDRETGNLRAALHVLLRRRPHDALRMSAALLPFWLRRIELEEARRQLAAALAACPEKSALGAEALLAAAAIELRAGALAAGEDLIERSREVASAIGDAEREWRALQFLGEFALAVDDVELAVTRFERALDVARAANFVAGEAISIHSLGVAAWVADELEPADELASRGIELLLGVDDPDATVPSPVNIAEIRLEIPGRLVGPRLLFEDTLQPFVAVPCAAAIGYALANRAGIARRRGDFPTALALLAESEERFSAASDDRGVATTLVRRAYTYLAQGQAPAAQAELERALELRGNIGDRRGRGLVLAGLALVEIVAGAYDRADAQLSGACDVFRRPGDRWALSSTLWRAADLAIARGNVDDADAALTEAYTVLQTTQRERWLANTLIGLAEVATLRGNPARAAEILDEARERFAARRDAVGVANVDERLRELQIRRKVH